MTPFHIHPHGAASRRQRGFSLLELSVVLIVIGLLLGAVAVGRDSVSYTHLTLPTTPYV